MSRERSASLPRRAARSHSRSHSSRVYHTAFRAADDLEKIQADAGRQWYDTYCTPCHGAARAPGSATFADGKKRVDLRDYVARNGGRFPAERWISVVTTDNPTLVHTAVWERIRESQGTSISSDAAGRAVVVSIAYYVRSIQR